MYLSLIKTKIMIVLILLYLLFIRYIFLIIGNITIMNTEHIYGKDVSSSINDNTEHSSEEEYCKCEFQNPLNLLGM